MPVSCEAQSLSASHSLPKMSWNTFGTLSKEKRAQKVMKNDKNERHLQRRGRSPAPGDDSRRDVRARAECPLEFPLTAQDDLVYIENDL